MVQCNVRIGNIAATALDIAGIKREQWATWAVFTAFATDSRLSSIGMCCDGDCLHVDLSSIFGDYAFIYGATENAIVLAYVSIWKVCILISN